MGLYDVIKDAFIDEALKIDAPIKKSYLALTGKEGKCKVCAGKGYIKTAMDFLSDIYETCDECQGKRFNSEVLKLKVNNYDISQILNCSFTELSTIIEDNKLLVATEVLSQLGLGYLSCGQTLNTLSGGELQRLKLAKTLLESKGKPTLFLLDEPTTGLHMQDVEELMRAFDNLLHKGHSLIVVEHHKTVVDNADYLIELGPGAGEDGGEVVE